MSSLNAYILAVLAGGLCVTISDAYSFLDPTKQKGCVDIVGAQGGCCDPAIHGSCLVFRSKHDYCYCEGTCFLDEFCCSDIYETGCVAVQVEPDEANEEMMDVLEKEFRVIRSAAVKQRKIEAAREERIRSRRASAGVNGARKQANNGNLDNAKAINDDKWIAPQPHQARKNTFTQKTLKSTENKASWYLTKTGQVPKTNIGTDSDAKQYQGNGMAVHAREAPNLKPESNKASWYLTKTGHVPITNNDIASNAEPYQRNGNLIHTQEETHLKADTSGEKVKDVDSIAQSSSSTKGSIYPLLATFQQLLKALMDAVMPGQSKTVMQSDFSKSSHGNPAKATQRWTTPVLVDGGTQSHGRLLHRPVGDFASSREAGVPNKVGSQTTNNWKSPTNQGQVRNAKTSTPVKEGGAVKVGNAGRYGVKRPSSSDIGYGYAKANPWLARRRMGKTLQNTMMKVKTSANTDHSDPPLASSHSTSNQMQRPQHRRVKRALELHT